MPSVIDELTGSDTTSQSRASSTTFYTASEQYRFSVGTVTTYHTVEDPAIALLTDEADLRVMFSELDVTRDVQDVVLRSSAHGGNADIRQARLHDSLASPFVMLSLLRCRLNNPPRLLLRFHAEHVWIPARYGYDLHAKQRFIVLIRT